MVDFSVDDASEQAAAHPAEVKKIVNYLILENMRDRREICEKANINEHTLDVFLRRNPEAVRKSNTLTRLYRFVTEEVEGTELEGNREAFVSWNNLVSSKRYLSDSEFLFKRLVEYMDCSVDRINTVGNLLEGTYFVYRNSVALGRVVKTKLVIREDEKLNRMWLFEHVYKDSFGNMKKSSGVLLVMSGNVYCFGKIGFGSGMEVITFREPSSQRQELIQAILLSLDSKQQPVTARAVLKRSLTDEEFGSFDSCSLESEMSTFASLLENPKDANRATTLNLM